MSRNEIRLRRHRMTARGADRFRNYSDVLQRHERDMKIKKIVRVFIMFMIILILIALIFVLWRVEQGDVPFEKKKSSYEVSFHGLPWEPRGSPDKSGYDIFVAKGEYPFLTHSSTSAPGSPSTL